MINKVIIIGRLGREPELKYTQSGMPVTTLNIATDESYTDKQGNKVERTEWHRVVLFNRQAETASQYLNKGSLVYVEGKLSTRKWQDQKGEERFITEIMGSTIKFLSYNDKNQNKQDAGYYQEDMGQPFPSEASDMDDTPF